LWLRPSKGRVFPSCSISPPRLTTGSPSNSSYLPALGIVDKLRDLLTGLKTLRLTDHGVGPVQKFGQHKLTILSSDRDIIVRSGVGKKDKSGGIPRALAAAALPGFAKAFSLAEQ